MTGSVKIAFFDSRPYDIQSFDNVNKDYGYTIKYFEPHLREETAPLAKGFPIVCAFVNDVLDAATVNILKDNGTKLIALRCAGYNNVDLKAVYKKIHVARVPAYSPYAVAEHATALLLGLNRKIHRAYLRIREMNFNINGLLGFDIHGKTVGVIGTGRIGRVFVDIMKGFGTDVIAYDAYPDETFAKEKNVAYVELDQIFKRSDIISLHCPLTKETKYLIDRDTISKMKDGVIIINTSRGKLINTADLIEGLKNKKIGAAGLDVYEEESEVFFEDFSDAFIDDDVLARLITFPNVMMTSHQGFFTREALQNIAHTTLQNIKEFMKDDLLKNEVCYRCDEKPCKKESQGKCF